METKHTPTPWRFDSSENVDSYTKKLYRYVSIAPLEENAHHGMRYLDKTCKLALMPQTSDYELDKINKANAEFIVRACNAHDDLVLLLQLTLDYISPETHVLRSKIEAALAKARGEA